MRTRRDPEEERGGAREHEKRVVKRTGEEGCRGSWNSGVGLERLLEVRHHQDVVALAEREHLEDGNGVDDDLAVERPVEETVRHGESDRAWLLSA